MHDTMTLADALVPPDFQ